MMPRRSPRAFTGATPAIATSWISSRPWALPVAGLSYWIQGAPRKDAPFTAEAGSGGAPGVLRQDGWTIVYQAFATDASGTSRPARMTLDYPGVELRLVIDAWQ